MGDHSEVTGPATVARLVTHEGKLLDTGSDPDDVGATVNSSKAWLFVEFAFTL